MPTTIVSSNTRQVSGAGTGRTFDYMQNGYLWFCSADTTDDVIHFYYSTDGGTNWTESTASQLSIGTLGTAALAFFIDKDNNAHIVSATSSNATTYVHGVASGDFKSFEWQTPLNISGGSQGLDSADVVAHREGTGWVAHVVSCEYNSGATAAEVYWTQITITSDHACTPVTTSIKNFGGLANAFAAIDFRHTESDPKEVQSSTPSVYVVYMAFTPSNLFFKKIAYSGGAWTPGTERTIDAVAQATGGFNFSLVYDGTRIMMTGVKGASPTVLRVWERDEADTTTTARDPTALADGNLNTAQLGLGKNGDVWLVAKGITSFDWKKIRFNRAGVAWAAAWTLIEADTTGSELDITIARGMQESLGVVYELFSPSPNQARFDTIFSAHEAGAFLQGVGSMDATAALGIAAQASLQGVGTVAPIGNVGHGPTATLQGIGTLDAPATFTPKLDFTVYDLYLDDGENVYACISHEDNEVKGATNANPIRAEKQDVGQNPLEQRPEFGDHFAQGDFSHGADQEHYHHVGRDERKFFSSEGFDISEPGGLKHLHDVLETLNSTTVGRITQAAGVLFATDVAGVKKHDGILPGQWNVDLAAADVVDIASRGAEVFAARGASGAYIRSSAGAWSVFQPDGATNLVVGTATKVEWLKDRLMVVGTGGREIFEVVADSTPAALKTLPEGWTFESIFEAGAFLYAPAVNAAAGLSRVHIFGLNNNASALEDKGSVPIPRGELMYAGIGDPGGIFLGGGRKTSDGGYDPVFYQAIQGENGFLQLLKITQGEGAGALDCSVRAFESLGDAIVMSWSVGSGAPTGARTGLAWYHLGRQAFAFHLRKQVPTASPITDIIFHAGILLFVVDGDGVYYEDLENYVAEATLTSSIADWGTAGLKSWDQSEVSHKALPASSSVALQYTTEHPEQNEWTTALTSSTAGTLGAAGRLSNIISRLFAVKIVSRASTDASQSPSIQGFSVRSNPTRSEPEFVLSRFIRVLAKDRKDGQAPQVFMDPVERRIALLQLLDSWVTVYEPGITWEAFVKSVGDAEPAEPFLSATDGEALKEAYLVRMDMVATGGAA